MVLKKIIVSNISYGKNNDDENKRIKSGQFDGETEFENAQDQDADEHQ